MAKPVRTLVCGIILACATCAWAQEAATFPCETTDGVKLNWGQQIADTKLELNTDMAYVSEGKASIRVCSVTQPDAKGNSYIGFRVPIEPTDMKDKTIQFDAWSSRPENTKALYVRGFNKAGKHVLSWNSWAGPVKKEKTSFTLVPGQKSGALDWEAAKIEAPDDTVAFIDFIAGSPTKGDPFDLYIDNVKVAPAAK